MLGSLQIGPVQFAQPVWLALIPLTWAMSVWIARRTLSGMGTPMRRASLALRLLVFALLAGAMADPQWRREADLVAVTVVLDASRSQPAALQAEADAYLKKAAEKATEKNLLGLVTVARDAYVQALPRPVGESLDIQNIGATDGTNLEGGTRLGMAVMRENAANRLLIVSDGNETAGSLLSAAAAAKAAGIPIDVLPLQYTYEREVIADRVIAPSGARVGETVNLRVVLTSTHAARGRLSLRVNGEEADLDPGSDATGLTVDLKPGTNVVPIPMSLARAGPQRFEAVFTPEPDASGRVGDSIAENNRAGAVTFVTGEGRVLVIASEPASAGSFVRAISGASIGTDVVTPAQAPTSLVELGAYDAVVLAGAAAYDFSQAQQEELRAYVHDLGGGLMMTGGPDAFGAGGWIGSPVADALPVKLDPPQKRQMPRGALALVMHSCEMPNGNYWGKRTASAAVEALSRQDLAGVLEYGWQSGAGNWTYPLSVVGDKSDILRAINNMVYGDMPDFVSILTSALAALKEAKAGQKHVILISDGDPQPPGPELLAEFAANKISISTVAVFPHTWGGGSSELSRMRQIAEMTGGQYHEITSNNQLNSLPQIFIKEAQTVRRSLIWEGDAFSPAPGGGLSEPMRGIQGPYPGVTGYIVTADREGLSQVTLRGPENDPILAQWQYGLGRAVAYTPEVGGRWTTAWEGWPQFRAFWEQHLRWVMRPSGSPNIRVTASPEGDRTRVVVEALDEKGEPLNFLRWRGRSVRPDLKADGVDLRQSGPGRYEASVDASQAGSYVMSLRYEQTRDDGSTSAGVVQAAVTRPFADEFRTLRDNAALLKQVASITNGRVLSTDPAQADLWSSAGLTMPVALTPVRLGAALLAVVLFLLDVGVRRVRLDLHALAVRIGGLFSAARRVSAGEQMASLKGARDRAKQRLERPGAAPSPRGDIGSIEAAPASSEDARARAAVAAVKTARFEATPEELKAARASGASASAPGVGSAASRVEPGRQGDDAAKPGEGGEGMSRLLRAKQRAKRDMEE
ncbi:MAG: VWA domain-containing protein [Phycisphaerae bacterium]|nr:VWA domain-containing protein [Phycisphaerae bacterium]